MGVKGADRQGWRGRRMAGSGRGAWQKRPASHVQGQTREDGTHAARVMRPYARWHFCHSPVSFSSHEMYPLNIDRRIHTLSSNELSVNLIFLLQSDFVKSQTFCCCCCCFLFRVSWDHLQKIPTWRADLLTRHRQRLGKHPGSITATRRGFGKDEWEERQKQLITRMMAF